MSKNTQFIAGMLFQNIAYRLSQENLNELAATFTIEADIPKKFFCSNDWEVYDSSVYPYSPVTLSLRDRIIKKIASRVVKELSEEFKDYNISYQSIRHRLFNCVYFTFKFSKREPLQELTIREIEDKLGYKIKIVG